MKKFWHTRLFARHHATSRAHEQSSSPKILHTSSPKSFIKRPLTIAITTIGIGALIVSPVASANVFDPLLKILLPFYKSAQSTDSDTPTQTAAETKSPTDGNGDGNDNGDNNHSYADTPIDTPTDTLNSIDVSSDASNHADATTDGTANDDALQGNIQDNALDLPAVLLDDTLIAGDIEPMLETPDLYALLDAEFAADRGEIGKALTIYKAESFKDNATSVFERALSLSIEFESPAESLAFATAWQDKNPEHIPAWFYVTHLALKAGEYSQAASMISTILHYDPRSDLGQILTGVIPTNPDDKRALLYALQNLGENNASISVLRAGILMGLGELDAARLHVNQALKLEPNNLAFIALKLDILRAANRMDELWTYLHQVRKKLPKEKDLYLYEIRYLIEKGELTSAWNLLTLATKQTNDPDVTLLAGLVGLDSGRNTDAIAVLQTLLNNPTLASQAHYYMGIGYERLGDIAHARQHYEKVNHYEHVLDARTKVVGYYLMENNTDAAISTLTRLRDEFESYATDSYILQAEIYLRQGDKVHAKDLLTLANREYPDDDRLLYASYKLLEDELEPEDKRQAIDKLLAIDDFNPEYRLADAKFRLSQDPDDAEALNTARQISNISFDDPIYDSQLQLDALLVLGNHALAKGDYQAVIDYLQAPYDVSPTLNVGITLLRAYQGLGDMASVNALLADMQTRFGVGQNSTADSQIY